jgi:benzoate-CoA ligase
MVLPVHTPPETFNFAAHLLACNTQRSAKLAYVDDQIRMTYGELATAVVRFASACKARGLRREDRVLLLMHDCTDWPVAFLGLLHAGVVPVAVNTLLSAKDYAYMLAHSRSQAAFVSAALAPVLREAMGMGMGAHDIQELVLSRAAPDHVLGADESRFESWLQQSAAGAAPAPTKADEAAFWLYSSGSTGQPKGTVHTHANAYWTAELYGKQTLGLRESDVCFSAAKLFFAYGLGNALSFPLSVGATTVLMAERPTPDAVFKRWQGLLPTQQGLKPTVFFGAPTGYAGLLAAADAPQPGCVSLRMCSSAGEALPAEVGERFTQRYGVGIVDGIGSTEMLHIFLSNTPDQIRYGTTGWPVPGYEVQLRGDNGQPVADGECGDLYIRGPSAALMYWQNHAKSRATFQGEWTHSGDKYLRNSDGSYTYSGRSDDMLKVSGIYVSPFEVEATLIQHPSVLEAAVIGIQDEQGLTKTKAFIVLKPGQSTTEAELKAFVKDRLAAYKYPRQIQFIDELPKTATGKIQRFKLRQLQGA